MTKDKANKLTVSKAAKLSKAKRSRRSTVESKLPILPVEIVDHIAKFLLDDGLYGACANLNLCSHDIHRGTLPTLYKTVQLESCEGRGGMLADDEWVQGLLDCPGTPYIRYLVLSCHRGNLNFPPFAADIASSIAGRPGLPNIRAIVIRHVEGSADGYKAPETIVTSTFNRRPSYDTFNGTHHAELLCALDFGVPVSVFEIYPSPAVRRPLEELTSHTVLPFVPQSRSTVIQSCVVKYDRSSAQVEEDPAAVAEAFATGLALVSYTRFMWDEDDEDEDAWMGPCDLVWDERLGNYRVYTCDRITVEATKDESMANCMQVYAELLNINPRFAAIPVDLYCARETDVRLDNSTVHPIFRPLRPVYKKACEAIGEDDVERVRIHDSTRALVRLLPVFVERKVLHTSVAPDTEWSTTPDRKFVSYCLEDNDG